MKKIFNQDGKKFLYFIIIAPILSKVFEWSFQWILFPNAYFGFWDFLKSVWFFQIIFILTISFLFFLAFGGFHKKLKNKTLALIPALAYFSKEVYNVLFVSKGIYLGNIIALTIELLFVYLVIAFLIPSIILKWSRK